MKTLSVAIFAVALASGLCTSPTPSEEPQNKMRDLAEALRDFHLIAVSEQDPLKLEDIPETRYAPSDAPLDVTFSSDNRTVNGLSNLELTVVSANTDCLRADFAVRLPSLIYRSNYQIEGAVFYINVAGEGKARFVLEGYTNQVNFTLKEVTSDDTNIKSPYIQIASIKQNSQYENFLVNTTGLTIAGVDEDQVDGFVQMMAAQTFDEKLELYEKLQSKSAIENLNKLLVGHDIDDVIAWLKEQIADETASSSLISFFENN